MSLADGKIKYVWIMQPFMYHIIHYYVFITDLYKNGMKRKKEDQDSSAAEALTEDDRLKKKKVRTTFTGRQIFELEKMFETKKYLSSSERTELAKMLNVTEQQVSSVLF